MNLLFQIYIALYILFASVTLCRLQGPMVFITGAHPPSPRDGGTARSRTNGSPLLTDPPAHGAGNGRMGLSILGSDGGSGQTPMDVGGRAGSVLQLIGAGDPFDLTGLEVRAGGEGEAHRVGCGCVYCSRSGGAVAGASDIPLHVGKVATV
jgi:hypothetical protein